MRLSTARGQVGPVLGLLLLTFIVFGGTGAWAQDGGGAPAGADSALVAADTDTLLTGGMAGASQGAGGRRQLGRTPADRSFFKSITFAPKAGVKTGSATNTYFGELVNNVNMRDSAKLTNSLNYSWSDFRQQIKTTESREFQSSYSAGTQLPVGVTLNVGRNWNEDLTTNNAGIQNVSRRDNSRGSLSLLPPRMTWQGLNISLKSSSGLTDQKSINQGQRNDVAEAYLDGGAKIGTELADGISIAGRLYGRTSSGDRNLGEYTAGSSARTDSVGFGVYYNRNFTSGRVAITRGNFERKYLDYRRNANGLIDTSGWAEDQKVVDETEFNDALSLELENSMRVLGITFDTKLSHTTDESDFAVSLVGLKERLQQEVDFSMGFEVFGDSLNISYSYLWKWDDQLQKTTTQKRGRQYTKDRDLDFFWGRTLFSSTDMTLKYHVGLGQTTAENGYLTTDKDRLRNDFSLQLRRDYGDDFDTSMLFAYKQSEDLSLHQTRSSNNNIKDSYEIAPGYRWAVSDKVDFQQKYRLYIQYTDYIYSDLEGSTREDNYNKRGNLTTSVTIQATDRLKLTVKHDYNQRFNAEKSQVDAAGNAGYFVDQRQKINKIDLGVKFDVVRGVLLEASTYSTLDEKTAIGTTERVTERREGKIWVGTKVNRTWGKDEQVELSAMIRKHNAYGPSVSEANADYWETDVWLKWSF